MVIYFTHPPPKSLLLKLAPLNSAWVLLLQPSVQVELQLQRQSLLFIQYFVGLFEIERKRIKASEFLWQFLVFGDQVLVFLVHTLQTFVVDFCLIAAFAQIFLVNQTLPFELFSFFQQDWVLRCSRALELLLPLAHLFVEHIDLPIDFWLQFGHFAAFVVEVFKCLLELVVLF